MLSCAASGISMIPLSLTLANVKMSLPVLYHNVYNYRWLHPSIIILFELYAARAGFYCVLLHCIVLQMTIIIPETVWNQDAVASIHIYSYDFFYHLESFIV